MNPKPICYDTSFKHHEVYSGVPSFLGVPVADTKEQIKGHDFAIMGTPWEGICTYNGFTGTELAPKTIRKASARYSGFLPDFDFDIFDHFSACDYGDCATKNGDREFTFASASRYISDILEAGAIPITFGGDHSLSYPLLEAFAKKYNGKIGIIQFDAHMDNCDEYDGGKYARCSPFHRIYELPGFSPENLVTVGVRGPRNHYNSLKVAREHGANVITQRELMQEGWESAIRRAIDMASKGTEAVYVTVCSDGLDVANNPGGAADPCGFTTYDLAMMLYTRL